MTGHKKRVVKDCMKASCICIWGLIIFYVSVQCKNIDELLTEVLFPASEEKNTEDVLAEGINMAQSGLFPAADYIDDLGSGHPSGDWQPTEEELEALSEENSKYEQLESEAEARLAQENNSETIPQDNSVVATNVQPVGTVYARESLLDFQFLLNNFYVVDASTSFDTSLVQPDVLLDKDLTMDLAGTEPKILIYHTHSQETFADSVPGDEYGTVVGLGNTLTEILQSKYGIAVYHEKGVYDMINGVLDRSQAYSLALPVISQILEQNPSIKVVIDLHRDGVNENTHLVTTVNGKPTAKIMFFNGLCRNAAADTSGIMQNPYLTDNLAFSLQMQLKSQEKFPDFTRRIYLRSYRYNMHLMPRTLLIECGAQTNTVEEAQNAMEPLADVLYSVLSGQ